MKIKNKKAQIGGAMQELIGTVLIAFIILVLFVISPLFGLPNFDAEKIDNEITEKIQDHYFVMSKLEEKVTVAYDGKNHNLAAKDIVKLSFIDDSVEETLKAQGLELLDKPESFYLPFNLEKIKVTKKEK